MKPYFATTKRGCTYDNARFHAWLNARKQKSAHKILSTCSPSRYARQGRFSEAAPRRLRAEYKTVSQQGASCNALRIDVHVGGNRMTGRTSCTPCCVDYHAEDIEGDRRDSHGVGRVAVNSFDYRPAASSGSQQSLTSLGTNDNEITLFPLDALAVYIQCRPTCRPGEEVMDEMRRKRSPSGCRMPS